MNEKTFIEEPRQIVETPYKAAECHINKVSRSIERKIKVGTEAFSCALSPWKWGNCTRDVFRTVTETIVEDVKECTAEQAEVIKVVMTPVVKIHEDVSPTSAWLRYQADLSSLKWSVVDDRLELSPRIRVKIALDIKQGFLTANTTLRGAATCESEITPTMNANFRLVGGSGGVRPDVTVKSVKLDFHQICVPGALEAVDLALVADPLRQLLLAELKKVVEEELQTVVSREIQAQTAGIDLTPDLLRAADVLRQPVELNKDVWLSPNVSRLRIGQLTGEVRNGRPVLAASAGLVARPVVIVNAQAPAAQLDPIAVDLGAVGDRFLLYPEAVLPLSAIAARASTELEKYKTSRGRWYRGIKHKVDVYQNGEKLVIAVTLKNLPIVRAGGTVYLTATPRYDAKTKELRLSGVRFDLATRELVVRYASWMLDGRIEKQLEQSLRFPLTPKYIEALSTLSDFKSTSKAGTFSVKLEKVELNQVWTEGQALHFTLAAEGSSAFVVDPAGLH